MDISKIRAVRYSPPRPHMPTVFGSTGISPAAEEVWRTIAGISTECDLQPGEYDVGGRRVQVSLAHFYYPVSLPGDKRAVEVLLSMDEFHDAASAHACAEGVLFEFLDRVALCSYSPARLERLISTCPRVVLPGQEFEMVVPDYAYIRTRVPITPSDISLFDATPASESTRFARGRIRRALDSQALEDRLLNDYLALERIANTETADTIRHRCSACGVESDTGRKATARYIRQLLNDDGVKESSANEATSTRGQLAHGGGVRDEAFLIKLCRLVSAVEGTAVGVTAERSGVLVRHPDQMIPILPLTVYFCKRHLDRTFSVLGFKRKTALSAARVKRGAGAAPGAGVRIGMVADESGVLPIDLDAWPD